MPVVLSLLCLPYLAGLGLLASHLAPVMLLGRKATGSQATRLMAVVLILGLLANYAIVLLVGDLAASLLLGLALAALGGALTVFRLRSQSLWLLHFGWLRSLGVLFVLLPFGLLIFSLPLSAWDARSIWYFHAKMIYYAGSFGKGTGWQEAFLDFSHAGYPKLFSVLAAQVAYVSGFWNEYLPKMNLMILLVPVVLALASLWRKWRVSPLLLSASCLLFPGEGFWNGIVDAYFAIYASLALLFLTQWLADGEWLDLLTGVACLGMVLSLKNEGSLFAVAAGIGFGVALVGRKVPLSGFPPPDALRAWVLLTIPFWGFAIWSFQKKLWGVAFDVPADFSNIPLIRDRIQHGAIERVFAWLFMATSVHKGLLLVCAAGVGALLRRARFPRFVLAPLVTLSVYLGGMMLIYLATRYDLNWHLETSAFRTMLPVILGTFVVVFLILQEVEGTDEDG